MRLSTFFPEARHQPEDSFDYLVRVLMARDPWMHRSDIAAATRRPFTLDRHDGDVVGQVAGDIAMAWAGPPAILELTGPAGGCWSIGDGTPVATVRIDAVACLRLVSGRPADGLPTIHGDPDTAAALLATRIQF